MLDDGGAPVNGRATVIRHITEVEARAQGLSAGYGLSITDGCIGWDETEELLLETYGRLERQPTAVAG